VARQVKKTMRLSLRL